MRSMYYNTFRIRIFAIAKPHIFSYYTKCVSIASDKCLFVQVFHGNEVRNDVFNTTAAYYLS